jgi:hypothetical protein
MLRLSHVSPDVGCDGGVKWTLHTETIGVETQWRHMYVITPCIHKMINKRTSADVRLNLTSRWYRWWVPYVDPLFTIPVVKDISAFATRDGDIVRGNGMGWVWRMERQSRDGGLSARIWNYVVVISEGLEV